MVAQAPVEFGELFGREGRELLPALFLIEALPENHGDFRSFSRRKLEKSVQCFSRHAAIMSPKDGAGKV
jgi:hypothetical protein